jgi:hypothetical protein
LCPGKISHDFMNYLYDSIEMNYSTIISGQHRVLAEEQYKDLVKRNEFEPHYEFYNASHNTVPRLSVIQQRHP